MPTTHHYDHLWDTFPTPRVALTNLKVHGLVKIVVTSTNERFFVYVMNIKDDKIVGLCMNTLINETIELGDIIHLNKNQIVQCPERAYDLSDVLETIANARLTPRIIRLSKEVLEPIDPTSYPADHPLAKVVFKKYTEK